MPLTLVPPGAPVPAGTLRIGFLNNLSDAALKHGERQISDALAAASGTAHVCLHLFSLPSIARGPAGRAWLTDRYGDLAALLSSKLDGLFVSGAEPGADRLADEIFWPQLAAVVDWARVGTQSTIWSCLAAHAAALHLDGIERVRLSGKRTGVFEVIPAREHALLAGMSGRPSVAHSRWNGLDEARLAAAGYGVLTRAGGDVDMFTKRVGSSFVFLQGHPEYDAGALGREYRRDALRFLAGATNAYPTLPSDYFSREGTAAMLRFEADARRSRDPGAIARFPALSRRSDLADATQPFAEVLFGNWLRLLQEAVFERAA